MSSIVWRYVDMDAAHIQEWLNIIVRLVHVVAAIMWIGDSFLFMFLDKSLETPRQERQGAVIGELWMTHGGGFYELVKRSSLRQEELPPVLHWFKWESYTTWITGFLLLIVVYYLGGATLLIEPTVAKLTPWQAAGISMGVLAGGWLVYDTLCTLLVKHVRILAVLCFAFVISVTWGLTHVFSGRAVFLHAGAMMATCMTANVFFRIIPGQKRMMADTLAGREVDTSYGIRAKVRSTHNHYITLPVLLTMLSNHFPMLYGHSQAWVVLGLLCIFGAGLKHFMNVKFSIHPALAIITVGAFGGIVWMTAPKAIVVAPPPPQAAQVSFERAQAIIQSRCVTCHAAKTTHPSFPEAPGGVMFDSPENIERYADRIYIRAVETRTMPVGNLTNITDEERKELGIWYAQRTKSMSSQ